MVDRYKIFGVDFCMYLEDEGEYVLFEDYEALRLTLVEFIQALDSERRFVSEDDLLGLQDHIRCILEQKDAGTLCG